MNVAMIFRILGWMLMFEAAFMAPSGIVAAVYKESDVVWLLVSMGICLAAGAVMVLVSRPKIRRIYAREGSVICALVWFLYSIFGALPFFLSGYITRFIDAVFETASGFTTTGASILSDVEALPHWHGHFPNWIDIGTLEPLHPRWIPLPSPPATRASIFLLSVNTIPTMTARKTC